MNLLYKIQSVAIIINMLISGVAPYTEIAPNNVIIEETINEENEINNETTKTETEKESVDVYSCAHNYVYTESETGHVAVCDICNYEFEEECYYDESGICLLCGSKTDELQEVGIVTEESATYAEADTTWQEDYNHDVDNVNRLITLNEYTGAISGITVSELTVPGYAIINGIKYQTRLRCYEDYYTSIWEAAEETLKTLAIEDGVQFGSSSTSYFYNLGALENIEFGMIDTSNTDSLEYMFSGCASLTSLDLSMFDTSNVEKMSDMFCDCPKLESINLSSFNTSRVRELHSMFESCYALKELDLSNFDLSRAYSAAYMFEGTPALKKLKTPINCDSDVDEGLGKVPLDHVIYDEFGNAYDALPADTSESITLTTLDDTTWQNDYDYTLDDINNIITLLNYKGTTITELVVPAYAVIGGVRYQTTFDTRAYKSSLSVWNSDKENLTSLVFESGVSFPSNCEYMFAGLSKLETLDITQVDTSNIGYAPYLFKDCSSLTTLDLSNFDTSNFSTMKSMFENCSSLTELNLNTFNTTNVTNMSYMFKGCTNLQSITFGDGFITSNVTIMCGIFEGCSSLTTLDVSKFNTSTVTDMSFMFNSCSNLQSVTFGDNFDTSKVVTMRWMFNHCVNITSLDVSKFNTANVTDMSGMFRECSSLTTLDLSNFNTAKVKLLGDGTYGGMFQGCSKLESLTFGDNFITPDVTNICFMFYWCESLKELDLSNFDFSNVSSYYANSYMFASMNSLHTLKTPKNCPNSIGLSNGIEGPKTMYSDSNVSYTALPQNLSESITLYDTPKFDYTITVPVAVVLKSGETEAISEDTIFKNTANVIVKGSAGDFKISLETTSLSNENTTSMDCLASFDQAAEETPNEITIKTSELTAEQVLDATGDGLILPVTIKATGWKETGVYEGRIEFTMTPIE